MQKGKDDFISLTDMVKGFDEGVVLIEKWLRNKNTIEFIGIWEEINNPDFNSPEFGGIKVRVINFFPNANKLNSVFVSQPFFNKYHALIKTFYHIGKRYKIIFTFLHYGYLCSFNVYSFILSSTFIL